MLLARLLRRMVRVGELTVVDAGGRTHRIGVPGARPRAAIRLHERTLHRRLLLNPELACGEAYMDGSLTLEDGTLYDFLETVAVNLAREPQPWQAASRRWGLLMRRVQQHNPVARARANAAHHYDLSDRLFDLFLDPDRQYSCAYFINPHDSLERAQDNKKRHIAAKLLLAPGMHVLDIGCGWGGLALYLARTAGVRVTGLTLSREQLRVARERAAAAGLADRVSFHLRDYREETGRYDRIVSVGMFEHVGVGYYGAFFAQLRELLRPDGVALLHSIGRMDGPGATRAWLRKYIFPGGYVPALSEVLPAIERLGLWLTDVEILRLHYAETLRAWRRRFEANRAEIARLYDERFCRMWEFYLTAAEINFRYLGIMVFQLQLARRLAIVPLTRDYISDWERAARAVPGSAQAAQ
jgi:cyclopropane-fatty-acyl-phospholipid synthase